ncbi:hypothetical protein OEZ86_002919 [Tetradesmus obliquus]|nr:hypothetical protein OEZ86_002919 [Tetradesmus obliquus]
MLLQRAAPSVGATSRPTVRAARLGPIAAAVSRRTRRAQTEVVDDEEGVSTPSGLSPDQKVKQRLLKDTIANINKKHGANTVMQMSGSAINVPRTPTGCLTLDKATGGGYPKGRIVEIFGPESSGKTTLAMHAIAEVQKQGGIACFIDAEHAFDAVYATRLGININDLMVCQPDHGEMAFNVMDELVRSGVVNIIVVDSVSALVPRAEVEGDIGTPQIGLQARLMSLALRKVTANAAKSGCTILFINQLRFKVGVLFGNPETTSGGNALKFYSSMRLDIRARDKITETGRVEPVGNRVKVKVVKNKVSSPYEVAEFDIMYGEGINSVGCVYDVAKEMGVIEARGSHIYFEGVKLAQGRDNVLAHLRDNPDTAARLTTAVQAKLAEGAAQQASSGGSGSVEDDDVEGFADELRDDDAMAQELQDLERDLDG